MRINSYKAKNVWNVIGLGRDNNNDVGLLLEDQTDGIPLSRDRKLVTCNEETTMASLELTREAVTPPEDISFFTQRTRLPGEEVAVFCDGGNITSLIVLEWEDDIPVVGCIAMRASGMCGHMLTRPTEWWVAFDEYVNIVGWKTRK